MKEIYFILGCCLFLSGVKVSGQNSFIGQIMIVPYNFAPQGWHNCDGALLPISEYDALFALIGTTYGGDGQTTFALPDARGRVIVDDGTRPGGSGVILGEIAGAESVTLNSNQIPAHTHSVDAVSTPGTTSIPTGALPADTHAADPEYSNLAGNVTMKTGMLSPSGGSQPHNNIQPYLTMKCVISLFGIFPSQN